jgi:hypothetical protein
MFNSALDAVKLDLAALFLKVLLQAPLKTAIL